MKASWTAGPARLAFLAAALWVAGCTTMAADAITSTTESVSDVINRRDVKSHAVNSIKTLAINRVAVMPLIEAAPGGAEALAPGATEAISAELYSQVAVAGGWDPIPEQDVAEAIQKMAPTTIGNLDENA